MIFLPTRPNQPQTWEGGSDPPPRDLDWHDAGTEPPPRLPARLLLAPVRQIPWRRHLLTVSWVLFFCFLSYGVVSRFIVMAVIVQGRSMLPTLQEGERFLLNRFTYLYREPERNELVVLRDPGHDDYAVKRIVGMPGDTIRFKEGAVYLNGEKLEESFLPAGTETACPEGNDIMFFIGRNRYFVMGDNRPLSEDSRIYGTIHRSHIIGLLTR